MIGVFVGVLLGIGFAYAGSTEEIAEGIKIGGLDVGGLTQAEAERHLQRTNDRFVGYPLAVHAGNRIFRITPSQLGVEPDWREAISSAAAQSDGLGPLRGLRRLYLRIAGTELAPSVRVPRASVEKWLGKVAHEVDTAPRNASLELRGLEPVVVAGRAGRVLDKKAAASVLVSSLETLDRTPIRLPFRIDAPQVTRAALRRVASQLRTALSGPVRLVLGPNRYRIPRWRIAQLLSAPPDGIRRVRIGGPGAVRFFTRLGTAVARPARDARFVAAGSQVRVVPALPRLTLDIGATTRNVLTALLSPSRREARIAVLSRPARFTTQKARRMGIRALVASETMATGGSGNWAENVRLAAHLIDNTLIAPGRAFSFNQTTGPRTAARGFKLGPVIVGNEFRDGFGGGVCEVSTMLFNAAFDAGLPITARTNHSLYIGHYPQGRDAAVSYPDVDLKFVNDTTRWLLLRTFVGSSTVTVSLYGMPVRRKVVSETAPLVVTARPPVKLVKDPTLPRGMRLIEKPGEPARATSVRRLVYDRRGKLLSDEVWYSSYRAEPRLIRVGTKKTSLPTLSPHPLVRIGGRA